MVLCGLGLLFLLGLVAWQKRQTFWLDEAMLLLALRDVESLPELIGPLPAYDQAAPAGLALVSWFILAAGGDLAWHKLLPNIAGFGSVALVAWAAKKDHRALAAGVIAVALLMMHEHFAFLWSYFKHYSIEILASALLVSGLVSRKRSFALIASALIVGLLFTNITPVLVVGVGAASVTRRDTRMIALAGAAGLLFIIYYFGALRASVGPQMQNYSYIYEQGFARSAADLLRIWVTVGQDLIPKPSGGVRGVRSVLALLAIVGFFSSIWRREPVAIAFAAILIFLSATAVAQVYPWLPGRYSAYLLPFVVHLIVAGLFFVGRLSYLRQPTHPTLRTAIGSAFVTLFTVVAGGSFHSRSVLNIQKGEVPSSHLALAARSADLIVPLFIGQPQVEVALLEFGGSTPRVVTVNRDSGEAADPRRIRGDSRGYEALGSWPLLLRTEQSHLGLLRPGLSLEHYVEWIAKRTAAEHRFAIIVPACFPHVTERILAGLRARHGLDGAVTLKKSPCFETFLISR